MVFSISGTLFPIILAIVLGWYIINSRVLFMILGTGLGVIAMIPPLIVFKATWEDPPQAVQAIRWTMGGAPVVLLAIAILFAWGYPISRESHRLMRAELAERLKETQ